MLHNHTPLPEQYNKNANTPIDWQEESLIQYYRGVKLKCKVLFFETTIDNSNNDILTKRHEMNPNCNSHNLHIFGLMRKLGEKGKYISQFL